jgi:hypothetical protein
MIALCFTRYTTCDATSYVHNRAMLAPSLTPPRAPRLQTQKCTVELEDRATRARA